MLKIISKSNKKLFIIVRMFEDFIDNNSTSQENNKDKIISEEGNVFHE